MNEKYKMRDTVLFKYCNQKTRTGIIGGIENNRFFIFPYNVIVYEHEILRKIPTEPQCSYGRLFY